MTTVVLGRFHVKSGTEVRAREWRRIPNERPEECRVTFNHEKMSFEAFFSEEQDGQMYLY